MAQPSWTEYLQILARRAAIAALLAPPPTIIDRQPIIDRSGAWIIDPSGDWIIDRSDAWIIDRSGALIIDHSGDGIIDRSVIYYPIYLKFTGYLHTVMVIMHTKFYGNRSITF